MATLINLYINESDQNTLNKNITQVADSPISAALKSDTEMINPTIILSPNVQQDFNYVYIAKFHRYYYVNARTYANQHYYVQLAVDPLMSFRPDIENLEVIANRSSSDFNTYQSDSEFGKLNYNEVQTQKFPYGFGNPNFVLAVAGGNPPVQPEGGDE
jgi:hypothetical protein